MHCVGEQETTRAVAVVKPNITVARHTKRYIGRFIIGIVACRSVHVVRRPEPTRCVQVVYQRIIAALSANERIGRVSTGNIVRGRR